MRLAKSDGGVTRRVERTQIVRGGKGPPKLMVRLCRCHWKSSPNNTRKDGQEIEFKIVIVRPLHRQGGVAEPADHRGLVL